MSQTATGLPSPCRPAAPAAAAVGLRATLPQHHCLPLPSRRVPRHPTYLSSHTPLKMLHLTCTKVCFQVLRQSLTFFSELNAKLSFTAWNGWESQHKVRKLQVQKNKPSFINYIQVDEGGHCPCAALFLFRSTFVISIYLNAVLVFMRNMVMPNWIRLYYDLASGIMSLQFFVSIWNHQILFWFLLLLKLSLYKCAKSELYKHSRMIMVFTVLQNFAVHLLIYLE